MKRRILTCALLFCVLFSLALPAQAESAPITIRAAAGTANPGDTIEIPISVVIPAGGSVCGVGLAVEFDSAALTLTGAVMNARNLTAQLPDPSEALPDDTFAGAEQTGTARYVICAVGAMPVQGGSAGKTITLATLTFTVNADAAPGTYPVTVLAYGGPDGGTNYDGYIFTWKDDENRGVGIPYTLENGAVTVPPPLAITSGASGGFDVVIRAPQEGDRLLAALYGAGGQMKDLTVMSAAAELSGVGFKKTVDAGDTVKFMWVSAGWLPRCAALRWSQS